MSALKKGEFSEDENRIADLAKAIGAPARIAILKKISRKERCNVNDLVDALPISQSTVSEHLAVLVRSKILNRDAQGVQSIYSINWATIEGFETGFNRLLTWPENSPN